MILAILVIIAFCIIPWPIFTVALIGGLCFGVPGLVIGALLGTFLFCAMVEQ